MSSKPVYFRKIIRDLMVPIEDSQNLDSKLEGKSRQNIAEELKISSGAVRGIIKDFKKDDDPECCIFTLYLLVNRSLRRNTLFVTLTYPLYAVEAIRLFDHYGFRSLKR